MKYFNVILKKDNNNLYDKKDNTFYDNASNNNESYDYTKELINKVRNKISWLDYFDKFNKQNINDTKHSIIISNNFPIIDNIIINNNIPDNFYSKLFVDNFSLNCEWNKATSKLLNCFYYNYYKPYDFKIGNIPVKVYGTHIQFGSKIIPLFTESSYFNNFNYEERTTAYRVALLINTTISFKDVA